ncbi:phage Gp37/Gp68 family protein [Streptomyces sp. NPDC021056]|uniref:DUF5131 family protein n=1 Tax=Streptomyces sp. NPDC021056 TaxID=3155012 RepID=UPI00340B02C3
MGDSTKIEWSDASWNVVTGCTEVSPGCDRCYAKTFAERWRGTPGHHFENGFDLQLRPERLDIPMTWRKPRKVFVNSMSDLFHKDIPSDYIAQTFAVMALTPRHTYQVLTKRHARMKSLLNQESFHTAVLAWTGRLQDEKHPMPAWNPGARRLKAWPLPNVHLGVSVEDQHWADIRIPALAQTPAAVRFLSCEPLIGPVRLHRGHVHCPVHDFPGGFCSSPCPHAILPNWIIIGGESGRGSRPFDPQWAADLIDDARLAGAAPFVKQLGSVWARDTSYAGKTVAAHGDTKGGKPEYWPTRLRVREYPQEATHV